MSIGRFDLHDNLVAQHPALIGRIADAMRAFYDTTVVMGGAAKGGRIHGTPPAVGNDTIDDVGQGQLIPTIAVDQCAATLARWFGVSDGGLRTVLPDIGNYDAAGWKLGFL